MLKLSCVLCSQFFIFVGVFFAFYSSSVAASSTEEMMHVQDIAQQEKLWEHIEWHDLLHYELNSGSASGYESEVDDLRFFNADDGKHNPESELLATITSFYMANVDGEQHPQCKFIARLKWLQAQLPSEITQLPVVTCFDYKEWRAVVPDYKVTLIFPAYHLNSPSSMFGHTLLRLDKSKAENSSDWLSMAVNFGANVSNQDNSLFFAFKGLSGGYPGFFIVEPYFNKIKEYNQKEKRDIWEYPLNLSPEETSRMVEHLWELKNIEFDYYFFDENCSYRLLELLEVARPGIDLTSEYGLSVIPVDTIRSIKNAGLIQSSHYRPSQVTVLENLAEQIDLKYQHYIKNLSSDPSLLNTDEFKKIPESDKKIIISTAYKYLRYLTTGEERDGKSAATSYQLLSALSESSSKETRGLPVQPSRPENGHYSKRVSFNMGRENKLNYAELDLRLAFHSFEDNEEGFLQGAQINMGNLQLRAVEGESVKLQRLDVIDIFSLTPRTELFDPLSWKVYTGLERQLTNNKDRLVAHVTGGAGVAYEPLNSMLIYGLLTARFERNKGFERTLEYAIGINSGLLYYFDRSTARIELSGEEFRNNEYRHRAIYTHNFALSQNDSIKLSATREQQESINFSEFNLAYQHYFF